jgi:hypothetical protein
MLFSYQKRQRKFWQNLATVLRLRLQPEEIGRILRDVFELDPKGGVHHTNRNTSL